jgi:hypothetical protein
MFLLKNRDTAVNAVAFSPSGDALGKLQDIAFDARGDRAACGTRSGQVVVGDVDH